jgi:hypothetical protein
MRYTFAHAEICAEQTFQGGNARLKKESHRPLKRQLKERLHKGHFETCLDSKKREEG